VSEHLSAAQILAQLPADERDRQLANLTTEAKVFSIFTGHSGPGPTRRPAQPVSTLLLGIGRQSCAAWMANARSEAEGSAWLLGFWTGANFLEDAQDDVTMQLNSAA
jgi:hypothetical protein